MAFNALLTFLLAICLNRRLLASAQGIGSGELQLGDADKTLSTFNKIKCRVCHTAMRHLHEDLLAKHKPYWGELEFQSAAEKVCTDEGPWSKYELKPGPDGKDAFQEKPAGVPRPVFEMSDGNTAMKKACKKGVDENLAEIVELAYGMFKSEDKATKLLPKLDTYCKPLCKKAGTEKKKGKRRNKDEM